MSTFRSVFVSKPTYPFFEEVDIEFDWIPGMSRVRHRLNEIAINWHFFGGEFKYKHSLEVSKSSTNPLGVKLSAMNLICETSEGKTCVESAFQSSRIYRDGKNVYGPFPEWLFLDGKECKRRVKEASHELHSYEYQLDGMTFDAPDYHISLFYDYLYINALLHPDNAEVMKELVDGNFEFYSDLATSALNSQARSCAIFVGLYKAGLLDKVRTQEGYYKIFRHGQLNAYDGVQLLASDRKYGIVSPVEIRNTEPDFNGITDDPESLPSDVRKKLFEVRMSSTYNYYFSHLCNGEDRLFNLRLGVFDIKYDIKNYKVAMFNGKPRFVYFYSADDTALKVDIGRFPAELLEELIKKAESFDLIKYGDYVVSTQEMNNKTLYPILGEDHRRIFKEIINELIND